MYKYRNNSYTMSANSQVRRWHLKCMQLSLWYDCKCGECTIAAIFGFSCLILFFFLSIIHYYQKLHLVVQKEGHGAGNSIVVQCKQTFTRLHHRRMLGAPENKQGPIDACIKDHFIWGAQRREEGVWILIWGAASPHAPSSPKTQKHIHWWQNFKIEHFSGNRIKH